MLGNNGIAAPGSLKSGSDSISVMASRAALVWDLLRKPEVQCVVGVRCSRTWDVDWVEALPQPVAALYVWLDLSTEELERRLRQRRAANGVTEAALPAKTYANMLAFRQRAASVFRAAKLGYRRSPVTFLALGDNVRERRAAQMVRGQLTQLK